MRWSVIYGESKNNADKMASQEKSEGEGELSMRGQVRGKRREERRGRERQKERVQHINIIIILATVPFR